MAFDQLTERDGHLFLDGAWVVDVARDTEELGSCVALPSETGKPATTSAHDCWHHGDCLDVGDSTGASEKTDGGGEWGLQTRLAGLAFEGFDKRGFLSTDVGAHSTVDEYVEVVASSAGVLADQACLVGFVDGPLEDGSFVVEFTADVDVGGVSVHGTADNQATLDQLLRVLSHNLTILASSGFTLIGVNN